MIRSERAGQYMHQRRLTGAIMPDQPDALASVDREINPGESAHGAKTLFDAGESNNVHRRIGHVWRGVSAVRRLGK